MTKLAHGTHFRIGYTEYRVWTLNGFYIDGIKEAAQNEVRYGWPISKMYLEGLEAYKVEQRNRGSQDRGASPQAAILVGDRKEAERRANAFHALPELKDGEVIELERDRFVLHISRRHNGHVIFEPIVVE
jgi:hypothetical protein